MVTYVCPYCDPPHEVQTAKPVKEIGHLCPAKRGKYVEMRQA